MKKYLSILALLLVTVSSFAQPGHMDVEPGASRALDVEGERSRIQAERLRAEANYQAQEAVCYARFAVTDCIRQARVHRREVLETLRHQELVLNDAERKRKALAQIEQIQEKSSTQRAEDEAARRLEARQTQQERENRAAQKATAPSKAASTPGAEPAVQKMMEQGRAPDEMAKDQKQYKDKLNEALEHRASRLKSNGEKMDAPRKSLPLPP
jgi:colicin import membrane protein